MLREFRDFIVNSSALDLAIGVVIGAAFGTFVDTLVNDVLMQVVAAIFGQPNFADIAIPLGKSEIEIGLLRHSQGNLDCHDPHLFATGANQAYFGYADSVVSTWIADTDAPLMTSSRG